MSNDVDDKNIEKAKIGSQRIRWFRRMEPSGFQHCLSNTQDLCNTDSLYSCAILWQAINCTSMNHEFMIFAYPLLIRTLGVLTSFFFIETEHHQHHHFQLQLPKLNRPSNATTSTPMSRRRRSTLRLEVDGTMVILLLHYTSFKWEA